MQSFKFQFLTEDNDFTLETLARLLQAGGYVPEVVSGPIPQTSGADSIILFLKKIEPFPTFSQKIRKRVEKTFFELFNIKTATITDIYLSEQLADMAAAVGDFRYARDRSLSHNEVMVHFTLQDLPATQAVRLVLDLPL